MVEVAMHDSNPDRKSALKPFAIRVFQTFEKGLILSKNVISIVKNARKCTISVKAKSAKNRFQGCKKRKLSCTLIKIVHPVFAVIFCTNDVEKR